MSETTGQPETDKSKILWAVFDVTAVDTPVRRSIYAQDTV